MGIRNETFSIVDTLNSELQLPIAPVPAITIRGWDGGGNLLYYLFHSFPKHYLSPLLSEGRSVVEICYKAFSKEKAVQCVVAICMITLSIATKRQVGAGILLWDLLHKA